MPDCTSIECFLNVSGNSKGLWRHCGNYCFWHEELYSTHFPYSKARNHWFISACSRAFHDRNEAHRGTVVICLLKLLPFYISAQKRSMFVVWYNEILSSVGNVKILLTFDFCHSPKKYLQQFFYLPPFLSHFNPDGTTVTIYVFRADLFAQTFGENRTWMILGSLLSLLCFISLDSIHLISIFLRWVLCVPLPIFYLFIFFFAGVGR